MSRIKAALLSLLVVFLSGSSALAQSENLIAEEMIKTETVNYNNTAVVEPTVYEKRVTGRGSAYYPYTYSMQCQVSGAKFVEFKVIRNQKVKAGDVLAVFALETDEVALAAQRMALTNAQETYEKQKVEKQEAIEKQMEQLSGVADRYERELLMLHIQRAQLELEHYCYQQECSIAKIEKVIAEYEAEMQHAVLVAPVDGVVSDLNFKRKGERVYKGEEMMVISRDDGMLLRIGSNNGFRYGMKVEVTYGPVKNRRTLTGRVVGEDTMLPDDRQKGYVYIQLDPFEDDGTRFVEPSISGAQCYMENVICIPRRAAVLDGGKHYVSKLENGIVRKRYLNIAMQNSTQVWVVQGLEEGETIIID